MKATQTICKEGKAEAKAEEEGEDFGIKSELDEGERGGINFQGSLAI